ncbi:MAG: polysaccharide deacetylase family protein [Oscillospiraceae bacterium]|nr:polysaccharide deacetylase family protein [Oscillospiraceae bacterium]
MHTNFGKYEKLSRRVLVCLLILTVLTGIAGCGADDVPPEKSSLTTSTTSQPADIPAFPQPSDSLIGDTSVPGLAADVPPAASRPLIQTGAPSPSATTYTGFLPLPARAVEIADPNNSKGLPTKKIEHAYGAAKNEAPHSISVENQKFFEAKQYAAVAYDDKSTEKVLYLTFDCGYENGCTGMILDTLRDKKVPAAFFCTLEEVKSAPEMVTRMIKEGHILGNHSCKHPSFAEIDRTRMAKEVLEFDNYLREHFGYSAPFFRFPKGEYNESALEAVQSLGFTSVFWSSSYADWNINSRKGAQYAIDTVVARLHPGAIILLHSVSWDNAEGLAGIIDKARSMGYEFRDLTDLPE